MKRLIFTLFAVLLTAVLLATGCQQAPEPVASEFGTIQEIDEGSIVIEEPTGGEITIEITPETQFILEGKVCTLAELQAAQGATSSLTCDVIYDPDTNEAFYVNVYPSPPASERGTLEAIERGGVTITTEEGTTETFVVTQDTQAMLNGLACNLADIRAAQSTADLTCTVIYDTETNEVLYLDVFEPTTPVTESGTVVDVDQGTVTIMTPQQEEITVDVTPETTIMLKNRLCTFAEFRAAEAAPGDLACNIVYDPDTNEVFFIDVTPAP